MSEMESDMSKKIKIEIKSRWAGRVLFEYEKVGNTIKDTVREALVSGADLRDADLRGADLCGADLCGATLDYDDHEGGFLTRDKTVEGFENRSGVKISETYETHNEQPTRHNAFWTNILRIKKWEVPEKEEVSPRRILKLASSRRRLTRQQTSHACQCP